MDKFSQHIDKIINKVLNEAAEEKATEVTEKLHGKQSKIDVAEPKGKITSADFKKLRGMKKEETKEQFEDESGMEMDSQDTEDDGMEMNFDDFDPRDKSWEEIKAHTGSPDYSEIDENMDPPYIDPENGELDEFYFNDENSTPGNYEGDEEAEEEAEELSAQEPTYVGRGLKDNKPFKIFGSFSDDLGWFNEKDYEHEDDFDFDYDEEEFDEFEPMMDKYGKDTRWFTRDKEGQRMFDLYKSKYGPMRIRVRREMEEDDSETTEGNAFSGALADARKDGKDTFDVDGKTYHVREQKEKKCPKCGKSKSKSNTAVKESISLTEDQLIDLIERIVTEQKKKGNIADKTPVGLEVTQKVLRQDKKENTSSLKDTAKKMKDYLKDGSKGKFEESPKHFPKGNGELAKMEKKAYVPDSDVEEYIEEFSYGGGMENLDYDEIKPNEEWMSNTLEGSSKTGNSPKYANAVETELGKKLNQKRKKNMFSQEKKNTYKKSDQPTSSSEKSSEQKKSDKLFAKLESKEDNGHELVMEQLDKMKHLFSYNRKTQ